MKKICPLLLSALSTQAMQLKVSMDQEMYNPESIQALLRNKD